MVGWSVRNWLVGQYGSDWLGLSLLDCLVTLVRLPSAVMEAHEEESRRGCAQGAAGLDRPRCQDVDDLIDDEEEESVV